MQPAAVLNILITANSGQAVTALGATDAKLKQTAASANKTSGAMKGVAKGIGLAAGAAGIAAGKLTVDFDKSMRNVNSIAQLPEKQFQKLEKSVLKLAGPTAQAPDTLAKGLYDLVSSGFSANESLSILASTARAATAGLTTTEVSTKAVAAVLNAYEMPASKAAAVSDVLFRTVDRGVVSFEALSTSIGDALPFAAELNVNIQQVGAAFATLTKKGISPEETATRIKGALVALVKPSVDMKKAFQELGVETGEQLIVKFGSLQAALQALRRTTGGNKEAFQRLFPDIRGASAALLLTGKNARTAAGDLDKLKASSGATTRALSQQSKSVAFQWQQMKAEVSAVLIEIGLVAIPVFRRIIKIVVGFRETTIGAARAVGRFFTDVWTRPKKAFGDLLAAILRGFAKLFDAASHLPGVGNKFKDLAAKARRSANQVDQLGEEIDRLPSKKQVKVHVDMLLKDFGAGNVPKLVPPGQLGGRGDGWGLSGKIDRAVAGKVQAGVKSGRIDPFGLGPIGPLGMGSAGAVDAFTPFASRFGLSMTSGFRPGSITRSGNLSLHALNRARDYADGSGPMLAFAQFMAAKFGGRLAELIHTPMGFSIKNGQRVSPYAQSDHYDHVHVALQRGGMIPGQGSGDKVPVWAEPGEGFINKKAVQAMGGSKAIAAINAAVPRFQGGGVAQMAGGGPSVGAMIELTYLDRKIRRTKRGGVTRRERRRYIRLLTRWLELSRIAYGQSGREWLDRRLVQRGGYIDRFQSGGTIGKFGATSYGPPWGGIQGTGITATGVNLKGNPHLHGIAVDPSVLSLGKRYWAWPNPFNYKGAFKAFDTGGAIKGNRIDFYDWRGRSKQLGWGHRDVTLYRTDPWKGDKGQPKGRRGSRGTVKDGRSRGPKEAFVGSGLSLADRITKAQGVLEAAEATDVLDDDTAARRELIGLHSTRAAQIRTRLRKINKALGGRKASVVARRRLTAERSTLLGELNTTRGEIRSLGAPIDAADDSAAEASRLAAEAANRLADEIAALRAESKQLADRQEYLVNRQGPQLVAALTMALSGNMGRAAALGRRTPAAAGRTASL